MSGYKAIFIASAMVLCTSLVADSFSLSSLFKTRNEDDDNPCPTNFTGLIPNPEDCQSFYICDNGIPGLIECPAKLCFNPAGACDHCDTIPGCEDVGNPGSTSRPTTTTSEATTSTSSEQPTTSSEPSSEATTTTATEEPSTTTSSETTTTEPTTTTTTTERTTTRTSTTTTTERTTTSSGGDLSCPSDPYIYMPYPGDCNKFYYCQNGVNTGIYNCGSGLWFNFNLQACVVPWGSSCT